MSFCPNHEDREISWICLEKECDSRVMCNLCAVKQHDRNHKVDEYSRIMDLGFINFFYESQDNFQQSLNDDLKEWQIESVEDSNQQEEIEKNVKFILQEIESNIRLILKNFFSLQQNFNETQQKEYKVVKEDKEQAVARLLEIQNLINEKRQSKESIDNKEMNKLFQEAADLVYEKLKKKAENLNLINVVKKRELLSKLKYSFLKLGKQYFENSFTQEYCSLFDIQIDTISKESNPNIMNENRFIDFIEKKWKNDHGVLENAINQSVQKLKKVIQVTTNSSNQQPNMNQQLSQVLVHHNSNIQQHQQASYQFQQQMQFVNHLGIPPQEFAQNIQYQQNQFQTQQYPLIQVAYHAQENINSNSNINEGPYQQHVMHKVVINQSHHPHMVQNNYDKQRPESPIRFIQKKFL